MYKQVYDPVSGSLGLTTIFAVLPLVTLFALLGGLRVKAQWAALSALAVAILVAIIVYSMPVGQALDAGVEGAAFGLFPIMWIVVNAIWIYNMTRESGHFAILRRSFGRVSDDQRVQAILIAFCFGALLEALAGFGTPVAITAVMLIALGFRPIHAASLALLANTAPVAFGALATPIVTLASVAHGANPDPRLTVDTLGSMVGRQTPFLALIVPLMLVALVDGRRGLRQTWPAALTAGVTFAVAQYAASNFVSVPLTDIIASLLAALSLVLLVRVWQPVESPDLRTEPAELATVGAGGGGYVAGTRPGGQGVRRHLCGAALGDHHGDGGTGTGVRAQPVRPDQHAQRAAGHRRRGVRVPVLDPRLDRGRGHRFGHLVQRAVRGAAGADGGAYRAGSGTAGRRQLLRRRDGQDDQPAEPRHRGQRGGPGRTGGRHLPQGVRLEPGAAAVHVRPGEPAGHR